MHSITNIFTKDENANARQEVQTICGVECYEKESIAYLKLETVARGLGFTDNSKGVEYVRWNTVRQYLKDIGFSQEVAKDDFIPENVFYRLAMKAKNETAEKFQAKVADEIIPSIRKHGIYATDNVIDKILNNPDFGIELLTKLKEERTFYQTEYFAIVMIFLFWPVGLFLMYKYNHFKLPTKICLTAVCLIITLSSLVLQFGKENIISNNEYLPPDSYSAIFDDGNKYVGKPIKVSGQILTEPEEDENFRYFFLTYDFHGEEQSIVVRYGLDTENFNQQDYVDIKGTVLGMAEGENIFGMSVKNLVIDAVTVEKIY